MRTINIVALFCLFGAAASQSCTDMFNGLTCRTASQNIDAGSLSGTRSWLCSSFPQYCGAINSGGQFASCSAAEQLSYAMNQYYAAYGPLQGSAACNFGGLGKVVTASSGSSSGSTGSSSCTSMFNGLQCRTISQNPALMDGGAVSGARSWLCSAYPQYCSDINSGGQYSGCNSVEQLSNAINRYYGDYKSQGASACNFGGIAQLVSSSGSTDNGCTTMFSSLKCRTTSQSVANLDSAKLNSARSWLCSAYPNHCSAINSGGQYSTCNAAEQFSHAANNYYNQFSSQGASACDFSGIAKLVDGSSSNSGNTGNAPATTTASSAQCSSMYSAASCKTLSEDPSQIDTSAVASSRSWLCNAYPQFCTAIISGGAYTSCNVAQQMTYAMSLYYNQFQAQGSSACNFGGIGKLSSSIVVNPTPAPSQSSKAGLAWPIDQFHNGEAEPALGPWATGKISWIYTWNESPAPLPISSTNLEWVPMLHGSGGFNAFMAKINSGALDNVKNVLLFNEPDLDYPPYAYALDVDTAVRLTIQVFQAMNNRGKSWRIGTPVMSWNINWLQQYMGKMANQCPTCKFSFVPIHSYTTDSNNFKATVQNYYNTFKLPVWITEFADTDFANRNYQMSLQHIQQWMHDTTTWLNAQSWVERYSWFGTMRAVDVQDKQVMAMNRDGSRNTLGDQYVLRGGSF